MNPEDLRCSGESILDHLKDLKETEGEMVHNRIWKANQHAQDASKRYKNKEVSDAVALTYVEEMLNI